MPAGPADEALADAAEEVRAYLVAIRGGAPFLSAADGRLLVGWLEEGVPVPLVLSCIDRVALRRQKSRARSRLSLSRCRKELEGVWGTRAESPAAESAPQGDDSPGAALARWRAEVGELPVSKGLRTTFEALLARVDALLAGPELGAETLATEVISACRAFHDEAWQQSSERELHEAGARTELAPLQAMVSPKVFDELVEEGARARLRAATPLVSAEVVWDRLSSTDPNPAEPRDRALPSPAAHRSQDGGAA